MRGYFKVASILSFIGSAAFIFVSMETGKLVFIVFSLIMLCNGIDFWTKVDAYNQKARAENREEK
jgi:hypothetical protein